MKSLCWLVVAFSFAAIVFDANANAASGLVPSVEALPEFPAGPPIPNGPETNTGKRVSPIYARWLDRVILQEFKKLHPGDTQIAGFLQRSFGILLGTDATTELLLQAEALTLVRTKVKDPTFFLMAGIVHPGREPKESFLTRAITKLQNTNYSRFLVFMAAANLAKSLDDRRASPAESSALARQY